MDYLYKRKSDDKVFRVKRMYEVFVGMISWYDGPIYETVYVLVCLEDEIEVETTTVDLFKDYTRTNKLTNI
jgi:hypothetical protein